MLAEACLLPEEIARRADGTSARVGTRPLVQSVGMDDRPRPTLDVLAIGETLVDFISVEQTDRLRNATTFRRYLGGPPANTAVNVAKLGGESAVASKTGIGAFGKILKSELQPLIVANCCFSLSTQLCAYGLWVHLAPREAPPPRRYASVIQSTWYGASRRSSPEVSGSLRLIRSNGSWMPWLRGRSRLANRSSSVKLWSARR